MHYPFGVDQGYQVAKRVLEAKLWMVRSNGNVVGPVSLELLERGLQAGKIPADSEMSYSGGSPWRRVTELYPQAAQAAAPQPSPSRGRFVPSARPAPSRPAIAAPPVPPPPPSMRYPEEPISVPKLGVMAAIFS